ncbi:MAG TPA: ABC transporter permease [Gemmatimonadaceae bacterium]|nr:ABC transporter permease [Gemmatimonadaceae bacterium]
MRRGAPGFARWFLLCVSPPDEREFLLDDLDEEFAELAAAEGRGRAVRWYWRQLLTSAWPLALRRLRPRPRGGPSPSASRGIGDDARFAVRLARRNVVPSLTIVATIALGIAGTTAVFSVVEGVLLRPLPIEDPGQVVRFRLLHRNGRLGTSVAWPDLQDYRAQTRAFDAMAGASPGEMVYAGAANAEFVSSLAVEEDFDRVFGLRPAIGRWLSAEELREQREDVVMLSHAFWSVRFGGDSTVVGTAIALDGRPRTVVGVMQPGAFLYPSADADVVLPLHVPRESFRRNRGAVWLPAVGRIRSGVSFEQAASELSVVGARLSIEYPASNEGIHPRLERLHDTLVDPVRPMLLLLSGAVVLVLIVAAGNVASLLLALANARRRELAVRVALGGDPWRVRRQLLIESAVLAGVGGAIGIVMAPMTTRLLLGLYPGGLPRAEMIGLNPIVLAVSLGAIALAAVLAWIPSARRLARSDLRHDLGAGGRGHSAGARELGQVAVAGQLAMSTVLVFTAGVLLATHEQLSRVDPGFRAEGVLTFELAASQARYPEPEQIRTFFAEAVRRIEALPGVRDVEEASFVPFGPCCWGDVFVREDLGDRGTDNPTAQVRWITPGYFRLLGIPAVAGDDSVNEDPAQRLVVMNETLARQAFGDTDPVGKTIEWNGLRGWRVAGVVRDTRERHWMPAMAELFVPMGWRRGRYLLVRHDGAPETLLGAVRETIRGLDPMVVVDDPATLSARMREALAPHRFRAALVGVLGAAALFLAGVGVFGLITQAVGRRTREIGIRMALGASGHRVARHVVWEAVRVAGAGLGVGALLALPVRRVVGAFLEGAAPNDVGVLAGTGLTLLLVTCAAALIPARRASRVDPLVTLQSE